MPNFTFLGGHLQGGTPCYRRIKAVSVFCNSGELQYVGNTENKKKVTMGPTPADIRHQQRSGRKPGRGSTGSRAADIVTVTCPHRQLALSAVSGGGSPGPRQASREPCLFSGRGKC